MLMFQAPPCRRRRRTASPATAGPAAAPARTSASWRRARRTSCRLSAIAEHLVGLVDLLELRLGGLVARVHVGMMLAGELAVRLLDLFLRRALGDAERLVVVLEFHYSCARRRPHDTQPAARCSCLPIYSPTISPMRSISCASAGGCPAVPVSCISGRSRCTASAIVEQPLHAGQVDAGLVDQVLDQPQPVELVVASRRACCRPCASAGPGPSRSYLRSVCGCMSSSRAAMLIK